LGDIIVSLDKPLNSNDPFNFSIITGVKFPTSLLDRNNFGYLNGYGTLDAIAGINCKFSNFYTSLMTQLPLTKYTDSNFEFNRGGDLIFQFAYTHRVDRVSFIVEGFMIKRLTKSEITEEINSLKKIISIPDSDFLQFNLLLGAGYKFNENLLLDLSVAFPLLKRLENSDGTKRAFSLQIGTKLFFQ